MSMDNLIKCVAVVFVLCMVGPPVFGGLAMLAAMAGAAIPVAIALAFLATVAIFGGTILTNILRRP